MNNESLIVYRSSAGSGKTYTLTREYLRLALAGRKTKAYQRILAVTFTNKAMQEMKDRIVGQLHQFSLGRLSGMGEELRKAFEMTPEAFRDESQRLLQDILHDYSHFSITTIDAFFQRVIRGFARELGLAGSYRLELDAELTIREIIQDLMAEVEDDKVLRKWLVEFARHRLEEGGSWMVERQLEEFTARLLNEDFQLHEKELRETPRDELHKLRSNLIRLMKGIEKELHEKAREILSWMDRYGLTTDDFHYKGSGVITFPLKILENNLEVTGRTRKAIEEGNYQGKSENPSVTRALDDGMRAAFESLLALTDRYADDYNTAAHVLSNIYLFGLTIDILRKMNEYKQEHDLMFISDATRLLSDLVAHADALYIYEKVGSFYDHFLIDEFQDTSGMQWESFLPLVDNSLAYGKTNLIVGDVKQSIYRWRGGQLELLQSSVTNRFAGRCEVRPLDSNYRSSRAVVSFNNAVFEALPAALGKAYGDEGNKAEGYVRAIYHDAAQRIPQHRNGEVPGYVEAAFVPDDPDSDDSAWEQCLSRLPGIVEELQDKGVPLGEMAILVRRNKEGKRASEVLAAHARAQEGGRYRYDVISNDSLFLSGSPACRLIIAALRCLHSPDHPVYRAELSYLYYEIHSEDTDMPALFAACGIGEERTTTYPESLIRDLASWQKQPLMELVEKLIHSLGLGSLTGQFAYIQTFMDHVLKFVTSERGDASGLLEWWDQHAFKESIKVPDDLDAIRIMTIHKSKGLEFHSVIIPYLKWKIDHDKNPLLWLEHEPEKKIVPVNYKSSLADTHFRSQYNEERLKAFVDNLNLLYVALTRASHDLWIVAPQGKNKIGNMNEALLSVLRNPGFLEQGTFDAETLTYRYGDKSFTYRHEQDSAQEEPLQLKEYTKSNWRDNLLLKPVNQTLIASERKIKINTGILIHQMLSRVRYTQDFKKALAGIAWEEALSEEDTERIRQQILAAFNRPHVKEWFSKKWKVINEASILTPDGEFRPDRVMISEQEVVIVDYKTGLQRDADQRQMRIYKQLLGEMEDKPVRGYLWYIDLDEIVEV